MRLGQLISPAQLRLYAVAMANQAHVNVNEIAMVNASDGYEQVIESASE